MFAYPFLKGFLSRSKYTIFNHIPLVKRSRVAMPADKRKRGLDHLLNIPEISV